jgi:hypothetical protein
MVFLDQSAFCLCFVPVKNGAAVTFGLESANVVGYQTVETKSGFTYLTPTFEKVDGGVATLGDFVPAGDDVGWGEEIIQAFNDTGALIGYYNFYCEEYGMEGGAGWYDEDGNQCNNTPLADGKGAGISVCFESSSGVPMRFSGAVTKGKKIITDVIAGFTWIGNATPNELTIQDFIPVGDGVGWGEEIIQVFDETNGLAGYYNYYCEDYGMADGAGWYDEEGNRINLPVPAGHGFMFESAGNATIELPSVL